jgi:hypothetical protein
LLPRQNAHDLEREIWRAAHQEQKLLLANGDELHVGGRDRGGAARRGAASINAISPKMSWSDSVPSSRLPSRISTLPRWMTRIPPPHRLP